MIVPEVDVGPRSYVLGEIAQGSLLHVFVAAFKKPVNAYVVDQTNLERYRNRQEFEHYGPGTVTFFSQILQVPHIGPWHLVIENPHDAHTSVSFKVL